MMTISPPTSSRYTHALIVDWPRRSSSSTIEADQVGDQVDAQSEPTTRVSFSEMSTLCIYERNCAKPKAYSDADRDIFSADACREALRVRELIAGCPPQSTQESVTFLFKKNVLAVEDFVGIENLILGQSGLVQKIRKLHAKTVILKQYELWTAPQHMEDPAESLAEVARNNSLKSLLHARARAVFAVQK